jgi:integrase
MSFFQPTFTEGRFVRMEDGRLVLYERNGIWQARIKPEKGPYIWRSLRTSSLDKAREAAKRLYYRIELQVEQGLPVQRRTFAAVMDEYEAARDRENRMARQAGKPGEGCSDANLRQIRRVAKFLREYAGNRSIEAVDDRVLRDYLPWRKTYYHGKSQLPKNAKLNPTDKTLQWEMALFKTVLRWAHERGYRGNKPLPAFSFTAKDKRNRPVFNLADYETILGHIPEWIADAKTEQGRATREMLADYVRVLALSGMRVGELNDLRIRDIEPVTDALGRHTVQLFVARGKTGERMLMPHIDVKDVIDSVLKRRGEVEKEERLFVTASGERIMTLAEQFDSLLRYSRVTHDSRGRKFTLYSLRHFYAVRQIARGMDIYTLSRNMGTSVAMIEQYYGKHAIPPERAAKLGGERGCYHAPVSLRLVKGQVA